MNIRSKRFLLPLSVLTVGLVFAAACGGGDGGGETPPGGATVTATEPSGGEGVAPADQQKITITNTAPEFVDPHKSNFEQDIGLARMLWRGLYNLVDDGTGTGGVKVVPEMAAGPPAVNGTEYTVKIKPGQQWSDGQPVTAADFVYGITRGCDPDVASPYQYILGAGLLDVNGCDELAQNDDPAQKQALVDALGVTAPDESTLVLSLGRVVPNFETLTSLWVTYPARKDVIEAKGDQWSLPENIVTNGPFTLSEYTAGNGGQAVLVPNPNWQGTEPALQQITVKFIDDLTAALRGFGTGEIQMTAIQPTDVAQARDQYGDEVIVDPGARITAVEVQLADATLADFNVRLALSRAIDREELVRVVFDDVHIPAYFWTVNAAVGAVGSEPFKNKIGFDVAAAKQALADAGYADGAGFPELAILLTDTPINRDLADYLVKAWSDNLGITVTPEFVEGRVRSQRFNDRDFQLLPGGWQSDYPDIENFIVGLFDTDGGNNKYGCSMPEIDAAITKAGAATDDAARIAAYQEAETVIVNNLCGVIPIYQNGRPWVVDSTVGGVVTSGVLDAGSPGNWCPECWYVKAP
jgi:oligopeptide transport system substrate-binding protein